MPQKETFMDQVFSHMLAIATPVHATIKDIVLQNTEDILLRKLRENYATLDERTLLKARAALGHVNEEKKPCKFCRLMAQKELELDDEANA